MIEERPLKKNLRVMIYIAIFIIFTTVSFINTSALANGTFHYETFKADTAGWFKVWETNRGKRGKLLDSKSVKKGFTYVYPSYSDPNITDREIQFEANQVAAKSNQKEAFFYDFMWAVFMAPWDSFWDSQSIPYHYEWPVLADGNNLRDIYIGVDLTKWTNSPRPLSLGNIIPVVNGRNEQLLPGYLIGTSPIEYVEGIGWVTASPLNGNVVVVAMRGGESDVSLQEVIHPVILQGFIHPITYTDQDGTFTTSKVSLTLNSTSPSYFTIDKKTGMVEGVTVMDLSFNNGKPGNFNEDLSGSISVYERGILGEQPILMEVVSGTVTGAGPFAGTKVKGKNPTWLEEGCIVIWRFSDPGDPPLLFLDLPPVL